MALWMVRSGRHGEGDELALTRGLVGIGWPEAGDLSGVTNAEQLRDHLGTSYPDAKTTTIANWVGQIDAFQRRMAEGDLVALPLKGTPAVAFGRVTGPYRYVPDAPESMRHQRSVAWIREDVPRESIDQDILYSLGRSSPSAGSSATTPRSGSGRCWTVPPHLQAPFPPTRRWNSRRATSSGSPRSTSSISAGTRSAAASARDFPVTNSPV